MSARGRSPACEAKSRRRNNRRGRSRVGAGLGRTSSAPRSGRRIPDRRDGCARPSSLRRGRRRTLAGRRCRARRVPSGEASPGRRGPGAFTVPGLMKIVKVHKPRRAARKGINPFTGEEMMFKAKPAHNVVKVRPLKNLKEMV